MARANLILRVLREIDLFSVNISILTGASTAAEWFAVFIRLSWRLPATSSATFHHNSVANARLGDPRLLNQKVSRGLEKIVS